MRRDSGRAWRERAVVQPGALGAGLARKDAVTLLVGLEGVQVDDVLRPLGGLGDLGLASGCLSLPGVVALARLDPAATEPGDACSRQRGVAVVPVRPVDEHVEAVVAGAERVRLAAGPVDDAVALPNHVHLPVLPGEA